MEVALDPAQIAKLLSQNAAVIREDLKLMEAGIISCQSFGANVTNEHAARLRLNLERLEAIISAYEADNP